MELKSHIGGNSAEDPKKQPAVATNLFVCSAEDFTVYDSANANIVYQNLKPFWDSNKSLPSVLMIQKGVMQALKHFTLKIEDPEARKHFNSFAATLHPDEFVFFQFNVDEWWIRVNIGPAQHLLKLMNEGKTYDEAQDIIQEHRKKGLAKEVEERGTKQAEPDPED